ncbi:hypothetical protein D9M69_621160 [compost metagenome]
MFGEALGDPQTVVVEIAGNADFPPVELVAGLRRHCPPGHEIQHVMAEVVVVVLGKGAGEPELAKGCNLLMKTVNRGSQWGHVTCNSYVVSRRDAGVRAAK